MRVLKAVLADLYVFARDSITAQAQYLLSGRKSYTALQSPVAPLYISSPSPRETEVSVSVEKTDFPSDEALAGVTHFTSERKTPLSIHQTLSFDSIMCLLPYGTTVTVYAFVGRWARVSYQGIVGWVLKDSLKEKIQDILPEFKAEYQYTADFSETKKLRNAIDDAFFGDACGAPLSSAEFVTYLLSDRGVDIKWGMERPRIPGSWQRFLRGAPNVHMGVIPKAGAIMESEDENGWRLSFVDAVFPDERIRIRSVSEGETPQYFEQIQTKEEWREARPIFIEISHT